MNEQRLIDANVLLNDGLRVSFGYDANGLLLIPVRDVVRSIEGAPTFDAEPVVRCKECKHRGDTYKCPMRRLVLPLDGAGHYEDFTTDDGYCHCGEKKEEENHDQG